MTTVKTRPLWALLSGPALIELVPTDPTNLVLGAKFAKVTVPVGKHTITFTATRETADAIQKLLALEVVDYRPDAE